MTVESASYISQLDTTLPTAADLISEGDDHLRLTKTVLKTQFPNFGTTAIAASAAEVNYSVGVTSAIQAQLNAKAPAASPTFTGTATLPATTSIGTVSDAEIARLTGVTSPIQAQINAKGAIAGQTWTGAHDFTGATPMVPTAAGGDSSSKAASTAFVAAAAFTASLPNQSGNAGKFVTTDGTTASWAAAVTATSTDTLTNKTVTGLKETRVAMAANNIDLSAANVFTKTITAAATLTVSNAPTAGTVSSFILKLTNGGAFAITWWSGIKWAGGTAPTLTASGKDNLGFYTDDGGTTWEGFVLSKDSK